MEKKKKMSGELNSMFKDITVLHFGKSPYFVAD